MRRMHVTAFPSPAKPPSPPLFAETGNRKPYSEQPLPLPPSWGWGVRFPLSTETRRSNKSRSVGVVLRPASYGVYSGLVPTGVGARLCFSFPVPPQAVWSCTAGTSPLAATKKGRERKESRTRHAGVRPIAIWGDAEAVEPDGQRQSRADSG